MFAVWLWFGFGFGLQLFAVLVACQLLFDCSDFGCLAFNSVVLSGCISLY